MASRARQNIGHQQKTPSRRSRRSSRGPLRAVSLLDAHIAEAVPNFASRRAPNQRCARAFSAQNGFERRANAVAEKPTKTPVPDWLAVGLGVIVASGMIFVVASAAIFLYWVWVGV
jgi:hypothetical protein